MKAKRIVAWILALPMGISLIAAGYPKLVPGERMVRRFEDWGYSAEFAVLIGALEILAGVLVLVPAVAVVGCGLVIVLMIGAAYTHLATGIGSAVFAFVYLALAVILTVLRWPDALWRRRQ